MPPQQLYSKSLSLATLSFVSDLSRFPYFPYLASSKRLFPLSFVHTRSHKEVTIKIHKTSRSEELAFQLKGGGSSTKTEMERRALSSALGS